MPHIRKVLSALAIALLLPIGLLPTQAHAKPTCIESWSIAAPIVFVKGLATVATVAERAKGKINGTIVTTSLCHQNAKYTYRLVIRSKSGRLETRYVDAKSPFE